jgi:hypothetical protein
LSLRCLASSRPQIALARRFSAIDICLAVQSSPPPAQRRRDDTLTQVEQPHPARQPAEPVAGQGLITWGDRRVEALCLGCPVTDPNGPPRFLAETAPGRERRDVTAADGIAAACLAGRPDALAHPLRGGLVVHAEGVGGFTQVHPSSGGAVRLEF